MVKHLSSDTYCSVCADQSHDLIENFSSSDQ